MVLPMLRTTSFALLSVGLLAGPAAALTGDWPQWRGPQRDGNSAETGLLQSWPEEGPALLWKATGLGGGYSAPAILNGKFYGSGYLGEEEHVWCRELSTGNKVWSTKVAPAFRELEFPEGPRATAALDGGQLFTLGAGGNLVCVDLESGKLQWSKDLRGELAGEMMSDWGYSESPLVDGDHVICTPGGSQGCVAAFDRKTGELVWRSTELKDPAAYASLIKIEFAGKPQYVVLTGQSVAGISAADGSLLWRTERVGKTAVVPTPIFTGSHVWVTSGYGVGCNLYELKEDAGKQSATEVYQNRTIKNGQGGALLLGDHVFAASGPLLICMDWRTGETIWRSRSLNRASLTSADGLLILRGEQGEVALVEASAKEYSAKGSFEQGERTEFKSWAHPVVSGGRLYLRDQDSMSCYDLKAK